MTNTTPWKDYPTDAHTDAHTNTQPGDTEDDFEYVEPSPLAAAAIMAAVTVWTILAMYGAADILGRIYQATTQ